MGYGGWWGYGGRGAWYGAWQHGGRHHGTGRLGERDGKLLLLSLLEGGPKRGVELMLELEERSRGAFAAEADLVYPLLQALVDQGLVAAEESEGKTLYRLTDEGRREVEVRRRRVDRLWRWARRTRSWGFGGCGAHDELEETLHSVEDAVSACCESIPETLRAVGEALEEVFGCRHPRRRRSRRDARGGTRESAG